MQVSPFGATEVGPRLLFGIFVLVALGANAMLFTLGQDTPTRDWTYFNNLSLIVRSNILEFHTLPVHNPWFCGGLDLLFNPQNRLFSPFFLFDLLFLPQWANILSIVALTFFGLFGMHALLLHLGRPSWLATVGAILFQCGSWFGLHYAAGHIPYGSLQLLPFVMYCGLRLDQRRYQLFLGATLAFMLLDGGIYAFVFSLYVLLSLLFTGMLPRGTFANFRGEKIAVTLQIIGVTLILALPKILPTLLSPHKRKPQLDFIPLKASQIGQALFQPIQHSDLKSGVIFGFHEFGCYLSWVGLVAIAFALLRREYWKTHWKYITLVFFWFWTASGALSSFNPWLLHHKLPIFNFAHIQARTFLIMFLFFIILLTGALQAIRNRRLLGALVVVLLAEGLTARNMPFFGSWNAKPYEFAPGALLYRGITSPTDEYSDTTQHLFSGRGTARCYEPANTLIANAIRSVYNYDYRGEAYPVTPRFGDVTLESYTPGKITLTYDLIVPSLITVNTRALTGWRITAGDGIVFGKNAELLKILPPSNKGTMVLEYERPLFWFLLLLLATGSIWFAWLWFRLRRIPETKGLGVGNSTFDYSTFPDGYYHTVMESSGSEVRKAWHRQKFSRVLSCLHATGDHPQNAALLDIGCFAGSFLSMVPAATFSTQVGVDVLANQVNFAQQHFGSTFRNFHYIPSIAAISSERSFDCITLIEVIEHLRGDEVHTCLAKASQLLHSGGRLVITTPNYTSIWPLLEFAINTFADVSYEEQHITKFNFFTMMRKLRRIYPNLDAHFRLELKTTTHFISPFLAGVSRNLSDRVATYRDPRRWQFPFGALLMVVLIRK